MHEVNGLETGGADEKVEVGEVDCVAAGLGLDFDRGARNTVDWAGLKGDVVAGDGRKVVVRDDLLKE
jgi:hypothetical protein